MRTLLTLACLAAIGGCAIIVSPNDGDIRVHSVFSSSDVVGNGMPARDERTVASLQRLEVNGPMVVEVRVGPAPSLVVEADSNLLPLIRTEASGDTLRISVEQGYRSSSPVRVTYTVPNLTELHANGSGRQTVTGLNGAPFRVRKNGSGVVELSGQVANFDAQSNGSGSIEAGKLRVANANLGVNGSGNMRVGEIRGEYANVDLHGSGRLQADGVVRSLTVHVTGSGSANLEHLASDQADLSTNGSGGIYANVKQTLVAKGSGSGPIRVHGNPQQSTVSGKRVQVLN